MNSMYDILLDLPLFKGVGRETLSEMVTTTPLHFLKYDAGQIIVNAGDPCDHIKFIIGGSVRSSITNNDGKFTVSQNLSAPDVIAPDYLFGRSTHYPCTVTANDSAAILQIDKKEYLRILNSDKVFLLNFLNILSMNAQKGVDGILALTSGTLDERLAYWILALTQKSGGDITLTCKTRDLYLLFGVQRSSFMTTLDSMKERGYIDYGPGIIYINNRQKLYSILHSEAE